MKRLELSTRAVSTVNAVPFAELAKHPEARGVVLTSDIEWDALKPYLARLDLIVITFPIFRDGRGFTQARALREYGRFTGEIRAEGHVLPDQANYLRRCGVDGVMLGENADDKPWHRELQRFPTVYQRTIGDVTSP